MRSLKRILFAVAALGLLGGGVIYVPPRVMFHALFKKEAEIRAAGLASRRNLAVLCQAALTR